MNLQGAAIEEKTDTRVIDRMRFSIFTLLLALLFPSLLEAQMELVTRNQLQTNTRYMRLDLARKEQNQVRRLDLSFHEMFDLPGDLANFKNCMELNFSTNKTTPHTSANTDKTIPKHKIYKAA